MENLVKSKKFEYFSLFCLLGFAAFKISYRPLNDVFQTLFILCFALSAFYNRDFLKKDPMVKLFGIALIVQIAAWINGTYFTPYTPKLSLDGLPELFFFIPIAYFLRGNPKYILWTLMAFCVGGILVVFIRNGSETFRVLELGLRYSWRVNLLFNNSNHPGLLGGALLLTSFILFYFCWLLIQNNNSKRSLITFTVISLLTLFWGASYVYISQARTTYLALFITLVFTPLIYQLFQLNLRKLFTRALPVTIVMFLSFIWLINTPKIHSRLILEQQTWQQIINADITSLKESESSIGMRVRYWLGAKDQFKYSPILGYGDTKAGGYSQDNSKYLSQKHKEHMRYLHNGHLEILLAFGLLGLSILWGSYFYLLQSIRRLPFKYQKPLIISTIAFTLYLFVTNCFESYYIYREGICIHNLLLGCVYTIPMFINSKLMDKYPDTLE